MKDRNAKLVLITFLSVFLTNCVSKSDYEQLENERNELKKNLYANDSLNRVLSKEMGMVEALMDSIDVSQNRLTFALEEGTEYEDFTTRVEGLRAYIQSSDVMIRQMEQKLNQSSAKNSSLNTIVSKMRAELEGKQKMISVLQARVEEYRGKNEELVRLNDVQQAEILDQESRLAARRAELNELEARVVAMEADSKKNMAKAYFEQGRAFEEIANRTNFAPKKKKEAYAEAYTFYKKAFENGHLEAEAKMKETQEKMD